MKAGRKKDSCLSEIQRMERQRDERRRNMEERKEERKAEEARNRANGNPGDVDFQKMIRLFRQDELPGEEEHAPPGQMKICICVRKRPINAKEIKKKDHDSVTCSNPVVVVHDCKLKVDGITKYLDNNFFRMDHTFHEDDTTDDIYLYAVQPLAEFVLEGGRATVFAYGQTGSGKTYTMVGIQKFMAEDLFHLLETDPNYQSENLQVGVSFFEIYGGRCQDLLNHRHRLEIREDGDGEVQVAGLEEVPARDAAAMLAIIEMGNRNRTTHATESNDVSSRSHAICQITIRGDREKIIGRLSLIDLAGSERGADTKSHNRQRRMEGAEINKSLLALKECVRALDCNSSHVPYRASKLTLVLKDSFTNKSSRTVMIVNVSPSASSADHTLNTLRYADRVKERTKGPAANVAAAARRQQPAAAPARERESPPPAAAGGGPSGRRMWDKGGGGRQGILPSAGGRPAQEDDGDLDEEEEKDSVGALGRDKRHADIHQMHMSLRLNAAGEKSSDFLEAEGKQAKEAVGAPSCKEEEDGALETLHRTVEDLFEEEEILLNVHMNVIQENAELLTEEGRLLQQIQGEEVIDYDIDAYAQRLDEILQRKQQLITLLQRRMKSFRRHLKREESVSRAVNQMPSY